MLFSLFFRLLMIVLEQINRQLTLFTAKQDYNLHAEHYNFLSITYSLPSWLGFITRYVGVRQLCQYICTSGVEFALFLYWVRVRMPRLDVSSRNYVKLIVCGFYSVQVFCSCKVDRNGLTHIYLAKANKSTNIIYSKLKPFN